MGGRERNWGVRKMPTKANRGGQKKRNRGIEEGETEYCRV